MNEITQTIIKEINELEKIAKENFPEAANEIKEGISEVRQSVLYIAIANLNDEYAKQKLNDYKEAVENCLNEMKQAISNKDLGLDDIDSLLAQLSSSSEELKMPTQSVDMDKLNSLTEQLITPQTGLEDTPIAEELNDPIDVEEPTQELSDLFKNIGETEINISSPSIEAEQNIEAPTLEVTEETNMIDTTPVNNMIDTTPVNNMIDTTPVNNMIDTTEIELPSMATPVEETFEIELPSMAAPVEETSEIELPSMAAPVEETPEIELPSMAAPVEETSEMELPSMNAPVENIITEQPATSESVNNELPSVFDPASFLSESIATEEPKVTEIQEEQQNDNTSSLDDDSLAMDDFLKQIKEEQENNINGLRR